MVVMMDGRVVLAVVMVMARAYSGGFGAWSCGMIPEYSYS